jgi:ABC-2 type transport system permease protein
MTELYRATWVIAYREMIRFIQQRSRLVSSFAMPLLFLVIFGAGFNRLITNLGQGVDFVQFMYPGIIAMTVLMTSIFSGLSVVWDREFGFLREVMVAPLSRSGIVLGKAFGGAGVALLQATVMLFIAPLAGVNLTPFAVVVFFPMVLIVSLSLSGLGILVASRMRSQQGFQLVMQVLIFPLMFLSGVFFPVNNVPVWLQAIAKANPVTYGVDAIRQVLLESTAIQGEGVALGVTVFGHRMNAFEDLLIVAAFGVLLLGLATWSFGRQE